MTPILAIFLAMALVSFECECAQVDDWQSEQTSSQIQSAMEVLIENILTQELSAKDTKSDLLPTLSSEFKCDPPSPEDFDVLRNDEVVLVKKTKKRQSRSQNNGGTIKELLHELTQSVSDPAQTKYRLKVSRITLADDSVVARVLLFGRSKREADFVQLNATWQTTWNVSGDDLTLLSLDVLDHEVAYLKSANPWFRDATAAVFAGDDVFDRQLLVGKNTWHRRIERYAGSDIYARHGHAIGDANGDGRDDVYVCQPGGLPNRLLLQQPDGTLRASTNGSTDWLSDTKSALLVDLDNDGDQDLVLGSFVGLFICENNGLGTFEKVAQLPGVEMDVSSLSAVDYDLDGLLDLHVCVYNSDATMRGQGHSSSVYDLRSKGGTNRLFQNRSSREGSRTSWSFDDVTKSVGLTEGNERFSLGAAWEDYDRDGDQDLYIANDFGINCLYENLGEKFRNVSKPLGVEDYGPGMSVAWGDFNRDGNPDLYVANMFSAAGNRVTRQARFQVNAFGTSRESFQRFNKGNSLYAFDGKRFNELPNAAGAENAQWAWSSLLADIDNDGWQDAIVANGYITGPGGGDL